MKPVLDALVAHGWLKDDSRVHLHLEVEEARGVKLTQVGTWQPPPYAWLPQKTLSCHRPDGYSWIDRDDVRLIENGAKSFQPAAPVAEETQEKR